MIWFIIGVIILVVSAIIGIVIKTPFSFVGIILGIVLGLFGCIYTQDVGDVVVLRNLGGSIAGTSVEPGFHLKSPLQDTIRYDIRNNVLSFMGDSEEDQFEGGSANGSAVTINDKGGAKASVDIQVNYSLDPSVAEILYEDYGSQENFVKSICAVDIRAIPREVSGQFDTISILTTRGDFTAAVQEALSAKWEKYGLIVEQVSIQNVVYPDAIVESYAKAQSAEIAKAEALNKQETAKVNAETKVLEAEKAAEANRILTESLTDEVLSQKYIDALTSIGANGNLIVVPSDGNTMINIPNKEQN